MIDPTSSARRPHGFRPDLEGLRAVAVLLVLLFHAGIPGFGGGYVGVDVFFVLSGFLITGLIVRELQDRGSVDLPAFYARRARRLLPAAALTLLATVVAAAILLPPLTVPDVAADAAAAAVYVSNIRFAVQATDYLNSQLPPSPLLHFWSLGVEEQFYLFWPALLLLTASLVGRRRRRARRVEPRSWPAIHRRLVRVVAIVTVASFALAVYLTPIAQPLAFFLLPTRAWELGLGALISLVGGSAGSLTTNGRRVFVGAGIAAVVAAGLLLNESTPFPGVAALLPTLGAGLVILGGVGADPSGRPSALLALPPLRFLGRISYSLYLWHWPILVLPAAVVAGGLPLHVSIALAGVAVVVAAASERWIERPFRQGAIVRWPTRTTLAAAGALSAAVAMVALTATSMSDARLAAAGQPGGPPAASDNPATLPSDPVAYEGAVAGVVATPPPKTRASRAAARAAPSPRPTPLAATPLPSAPGGHVPAGLRPPLTEIRDDLPVIYSDGCHLDQTTVTFGTCVYGDVSSHTTVVLFGDSHAAQWFPTVERLANVEHWRLVSLTKSGCTPVSVTVWLPALNRGYTECDAWRQLAFERIAQEKPSLVLVSSSRGTPLALGGARAEIGDHEDVWSRGVQDTVARVAASAGHVTVIGDTPIAVVDPPACLSQHLDDVLACATARSHALDPVFNRVEEAATAAAGASFVDPTGWICPTEPCPAVIGSYLVYRDEHHLTTPFAEALARRLLAALPVQSADETGAATSP